MREKNQMPQITDLAAFFSAGAVSLPYGIGNLPISDLINLHMCSKIVAKSDYTYSTVSYKYMKPGSLHLLHLMQPLCSRSRKGSALQKCQSVFSKGPSNNGPPGISKEAQVVLRVVDLQEHLPEHQLYQTPLKLGSNDACACSLIK